MDLMSGINKGTGEALPEVKIDAPATATESVIEPAAVVVPLDESKPHDPTGAILESNVKANAIAEAPEQMEKTFEINKRQIMSMSQSKKIRQILLQNGMDSQQAGNALNQILEIVQG